MNLITSKRHCPGLFLYLMIFFTPSYSYAQVVALALSSVSAPPGGTVPLDLVANTGTAQPAGLEWSFVYSSDLILQSVVGGAGLINGGKTLNCNFAAAAGTALCIAAGVTPASISSGLAATVTFQVSDTPSSNALSVTVRGTEVSSLNGDPLPASASDGVVKVTVPPAPPPSVRAISCTPANLLSLGSTTCSVALTDVAPVTGMVVALYSSNQALRVPTSVTVLSGGTVVSFAATASAVTAITPVNVVATATAVVSTTVTLNPPGAEASSIVSITCSPNPLISTGQCTVILKAAVALPTVVAIISSNPSLVVPSSVSVPASSDHAQFNISITNGFSSGSAIITAKLGTSSASATEMISGISTFQPIRVNSGGVQISDSLGQVWSADTGSSNGTRNRIYNAIAGTTTPLLYQTERYGPWGGILNYQFNVPNGSYRLTLKFAELSYPSPGQRNYNIVVNGTVVAYSFDPFTAAGGQFIAIDRVYDVTVTKGVMKISFDAYQSHAQICAIEILAAP